MAIAAFTIFSAYLGFIIAWYIFQLIACWSVFSKAGEAGWKSLIPVYNSYVLFRISWETRFFWYGVLLSVGGVMLSSLGGLFGVLGWLLLALALTAVMALLLPYSLPWLALLGGSLPCFTAARGTLPVIDDLVVKE